MAIYNLVARSNVVDVFSGDLTVRYDGRKIDLLSLMPGPHKAAEYAQRSSESVDQGDLSRFLDILWVVLETIANKTEGLDRLFDIDNCPDEFLDLLGGNIGVRKDDELLPDQKRAKIKSAIQWYRIKGTLPSFETSIRHIGLNPEKVKIHEIWKDPVRSGVLIKDEDVDQGYERTSSGDGIYRASILLCELYRLSPDDWRAWLVSEWQELTRIYREIRPVHVDIIYRVFQKISETVEMLEVFVTLVERTMNESAEGVEDFVKNYLRQMDETVGDRNNLYVEENYWVAGYTLEDAGVEVVISYWTHSFEAGNIDVDPWDWYQTIGPSDFYLTNFDITGYWSPLYFLDGYFNKNYWYDAYTAGFIDPIYADAIQYVYEGGSRESELTILFDLNEGERSSIQDDFILIGPTSAEFGPSTPYYAQSPPQLYTLNPTHAPIYTKAIGFEMRFEIWPDYRVLSEASAIATAEDPVPSQVFMTLMPVSTRARTIDPWLSVKRDISVSVVISTTDPYLPDIRGLAVSAVASATDPTVIIEMRPTGHWEFEDQTINPTNAYNGDDSDAAEIVPWPQIEQFYIGRDSSNVDQWTAEPVLEGMEATIKIVFSKNEANLYEDGGLIVTESDGTIIAILVASTTDAVAKQIFSFDVSAYIGDLADLRVRVTYGDAGIAGESFVYDTWIECKIPVQMRPIDYYNVFEHANDVSYAYDRNPNTFCWIDVLYSEDPVVYFGRNDINIDSWQPEPGYLTAALFVDFEWDISVPGDPNNSYIKISVKTSDGTQVGDIQGTTVSGKTRRTTSVNIDSYIGDLADLRVEVYTQFRDGSGIIYIYRIWIEGSLGIPIPAEMRPTGHYDAAGATVNEADAYDGDDSDGSTTTAIDYGTGSIYYGRNSGNVDQWETEPDFVGDIFFKTVIERTDGFELRVKLEKSDGTIIGASGFGSGPLSKRTISWDVTEYKGDLADLRLRIDDTGASAEEMIIYDCWIEGMIDSS